MADVTVDVEDIGEHDLICGAVVLVSYLVEGDDVPRLAISSTDGVSLLEQIGMLRMGERWVAADFMAAEEE